MNKRFKLVLGALAVATILVALAVSAEDSDGTQGELALVGTSTSLVGEWPVTTPEVTVELKDATVKSAIESVTEQAEWELVLAAPKDKLDQPLTLSLKDKPARDVLEIVLDTVGLKATWRKGVVVVKASQGFSVQITDSSGKIDKALNDLKVQLDSPKGSFKVDIDDDVGHVHVESDEVRGKKSRVLVGQSVRVEEGEEVGDAVSVGGSVTVLGHVYGDAVSVGGTVVLEPTAVVDGDAVSVGGKVDVKPGATLNGDRVGVGVPLQFLGGLIGAGSVLSAFGFMSSMLRSAIVFLIALLIIWIAPKRVGRVREYLTTHPGYSVLGGFVLTIALIAATLILLVTIIGIPLVPFLYLAVFIVALIGLTAFLSWIGHKIPVFKDTKTEIGATLIGSVICFLIGLIPYLGPFLLGFAAFMAAGAAMLSRVGARYKHEII